MPFLSRTHRVAYFPVPKAACTTIKHAMHELENGKAFRRKDYQKRPVQMVYPTQDFAPVQLEGLDTYWKIAVVRDPAKRIISAYANKITKWYPRIERRMKTAEGRDVLLADGILETLPTINEFLVRIEAYRRHFKPIKHHMDPFSTFLGPDLTVFNHIYPIEQMEQLRLDIGHRTGKTLEFRHANRSTIKMDPIEPEAFKALIEYCRLDYDLLAGFYTAPETAP